MFASVRILVAANPSGVHGILIMTFSGNFGAFLAVFSIMVGYFAAVVINFGDFARFVKNEDEGIYGTTPRKREDYFGSFLRPIHLRFL